jgi:hypothetical protein
LAQLAGDLRVPLFKLSTTLTIDDKPAATYHNGVVITDERPDVALHVDNKGAIDMAHAHGPTKRTKHLDVRHHYLQQCVARKVLRMRQCTTDAQLADCLTSPSRGSSFFKPSSCSNSATKDQGGVEDNQNNRNDPSPSASNEAFLEDSQRVTYTYTVSDDVIELLSV